MRFEDITEQSLLNQSDIHSVNFEHESYFSYDDVNRKFQGVFGNLARITLPLLQPDGTRKLTYCISYSDIKQKVTELSGMSDFNRHINTALNFNPRKK